MIGAESMYGNPVVTNGLLWALMADQNYIYCRQRTTAGGTLGHNYDTNSSPEWSSFAYTEEVATKREAPDSALLPFAWELGQANSDYIANATMLRNVGPPWSDANGTPLDWNIHPTARAGGSSGGEQYRMLWFQFNHGIILKDGLDENSLALENYESYNRPGNFDLTDGAAEVNYSYIGYEFFVTIADTTHLVYESLASKASQIGLDFQTYKDLAADECAIVSRTGVFTDLFAVKVEADYGDLEPSNQPWNSAPLMYMMMFDLVTNIYDGNMEKIMTTASEISAMISPAGTGPANIQAFNNSYQNFLRFFIDPAGATDALTDTEWPRTDGSPSWRYLNKGPGGASFGNLGTKAIDLNFGRNADITDSTALDTQGASFTSHYTYFPQTVPAEPWAADDEATDDEVP